MVSYKTLWEVVWTANTKSQTWSMMNNQSHGQWHNPWSKIQITDVLTNINELRMFLPLIFKLPEQKYTKHFISQPSTLKPGWHKDLEQCLHSPTKKKCRPSLVNGNIFYSLSCNITETKIIILNTWNLINLCLFTVWNYYWILIVLTISWSSSLIKSRCWK